MAETLACYNNYVKHKGEIMPILDQLSGDGKPSSPDALRELDAAERRDRVASAVAGMDVVEKVGPVVGGWGSTDWGSEGLVTNVIGEGENQVVVGYEFDPKLNFARWASPPGTATIVDIATGETFSN